VVIGKNLSCYDFTLKNVKDIPALKAVSQNLMHKNLSITDGVYGILSETDVRVQIVELSKSITNSETYNIKELVTLTRSF
jgi:hypothetical protein